MTLKPGETATKEVVYTPDRAGRPPRPVRDRRPTASPTTTRFLFTLPVAPQVKVVLVNGHPAADPFENEALYLRTALTAADDERPDAAAARRSSGRARSSSGRSTSAR